MADSEPKAMADNVAEMTYSDTCKTHGDFTSKAMANPFGDKPFRMGCPICAAERKAAREREDASRKDREEAQARARDEQSRRVAGVPLRFDGKSLDTFQVTHEGQQKALDACRRVVDGVRSGKGAPNLILQGKPGTGKTHLSCGMTLALYRSHKIRRIDLPDMIRNIRATWQRDAEYTEEYVLDHYGSLDLLILEEVGTGSGSDDERARVFQVLNRRYEAMLPTVIVTNLTLRELRDELGERVLDRLREGDRSVVVFDWESMRGAA